MTIEQALEKLYKAGRICDSPWRIGMSLTNKVLVIGYAQDQAPWTGSPVISATTAKLDTTDPGTVGCLLALWAEAASNSNPDLVDRIYDELLNVNPFRTNPETMAHVGAALSKALIRLAGGSLE